MFPLYSIVFAYLYYRGPLLGVVLAVARKCELPSFDVCLPCDIYILRGFSRCFSGFFLDSFSLFRPGIARAPFNIRLIKIYLTFYISLLQPLRGKPITRKVPPLPPIIINNSNSSYFINLINNI